MRGLSLRNKLLLAFILVLVPVIVFDLFSFSSRMAERKQQVIDSNIETARAVAVAAEEHLFDVQRFAKSTGDAYVRGHLSEDEANRYFAESRQAYPDMMRIFVLGPDGVAVAGDPADTIGISYADRDYFQQIKAGADSVVVNLLVDRASGAPAYGVASAVRDNSGNLQAVVVAGLSTQRFEGAFPVPVRETATFSIIDSLGDIVYSNRYPNLTFEQRTSTVLPLSQQALSGEMAYSDSVVSPIDGKKLISVAMPIQSIGWAVVLVQPLDQTLAPIQQAAIVELSAHAGALLISFLVAFGLGRFLLGPIKALQNGTDSLAEGDLDRRITVHTGDELEGLANSFNSMASELKNRIESFRELQKTSSRLVSSLETESVLNEVVATAARMVGARRGAIWLLDARTGVLSVAASSGVGRESLEGLGTLNVGQGAAGKAIERKDVVVEVPEETPDATFYRDFARREHIELILSVPMLWQDGSPLGAVSIYFTEQQTVPEDNIELIKLYANQAAMAVQNARLYESVQQLVEKTRQEAEILDAIQEVAKKLNAKLENPEAVFETIMEFTKKETGADAVVIATLDPDGRFTSKYGIGLSEKGLKSIYGTPETPTYKRMLAGGKFAAMENIEAHPESIVYGVIKEEGIQSYGMAPLRQPGGDIIGALIECYRQPHVYSEQEISTLSLLSEHAALALKNAQNYREAHLERQRLETIFASMADGVVQLDIFGKVVSMNPAAERILGVKFEELCLWDNLQWTSLPITDTEGQALPPSLVDAKELLQHERGLKATYLVARPLARLRTINGSVTPLLDFRGIPTGSVFVFDDVTERMEVEKLKDEFVSIVSHELRSPLTTLTGYVQKAKKELERNEIEKIGGDLEQIVVGAKKLGRLVNDLLDLSRLQAGKITLNKEDTDIASVINDFAKGYATIVNDRGILVEMEPGLPHVLIDPFRIGQVITNLVDNAVKYSPKGSDVVIRAERVNGGVEVSVIDRGIGFEADHQPLLFQRFSRVDSSDTRKFGGVGLGLYISRLLVESHGGKIWAESNGIDKGSTFAFCLPVVGPRGGKNGQNSGGG